MAAGIKIGVDSSGAKRGAAEANAAFDSMSKSAQAAAKGVGMLDSALGALPAAFGGLINPLNWLGGALGIFGQMASSILSLLNPLNLVSGAFSLLSGGVSAIGSLFSWLFSIVETGVSFFANLTLSAQGLSGILETVTSAIGTVTSAFQESVNVSAGFDVQMKNIQAVSLATAGDMDLMREAALKVGRETPLAASEAAEALLNFRKAGLDTAAAINALSPAVNAAMASGAELGNVSQGLVSITNSMSLGFENSTKTLDSMLAATTKTSLSMDTLIGNMSYAAPTAAAFNVSLTETEAALGLLSDRGFNDASKAGSGLNQIMLKLAAPTKAISGLLSQVGLTAADVDPRVHGLAGALENMEQAGIKAADVTTVFGVRAGPQMASLLAAGSEAIRELDQALQDSAGVGAKMFETQMATLEKSMISLDGSLESLQITIGSVALQGFKLIVDEAINVVNAINDFTTESGLAKAATEIFTAAGAELVEVFNNFKPLALALSDPLQQLGDRFKEGQNSIVEWIGSISDTLAASEGFRTALQDIGLAINAGVVNILNWVTNTDNLQGALEGAIGVATQFIETTMAIGQALLDGGKAVVDFLAKFVQIDSDGLHIDFLGAFTGAFSAGWSYLTTEVPSLLSGAMATVRDTVAGAFSAFAPSAAEAIRAGDWDTAGSALTETVVRKVLEPVGKVAKQTLGAIVAPWSEDLGAFIKAGNWAEAFKHLETAFNKGLDAAFKAVGGATKGFFKTYEKDLDAFWKQTKNTLLGWVDDLVTTIKQKTGIPLKSLIELAKGVGSAAAWVADTTAAAGQALGTLAGNTEIAWGMHNDQVNEAALNVQRLDAGLEPLSNNMQTLNSVINDQTASLGKLGSAFTGWGATAAQAGESVAATMNSSAESTKGSWGSTFTSIAQESVQAANDWVEPWEDVPSKMETISETAAYTMTNWSGAYSWGNAISSDWSEGLADGVSLEHLNSQLEGIQGMMEGQSPPKAGPLKNLDKGAGNIGEAWVRNLAESVANSSRPVEMALETISDVLYVMGEGQGDKYITSISKSIHDKAHSVTEPLETLAQEVGSSSEKLAGRWGSGIAAALDGSKRPILDVLEEVETLFLSAGEQTGKDYAYQMAESVAADISGLVTARDKLVAPMGQVAVKAANWGKRVGQDYVGNIIDGIKTNQAKMTQELKWYQERMEGHSPPKVGPLSGLSQGAINIGLSWGTDLALGINQAQDTITAEQQALAATFDTLQTLPAPMMDLDPFKQQLQDMATAASTVVGGIVGQMQSAGAAQGNAFVLGMSDAIGANGNRLDNAIQSTISSRVIGQSPPPKGPLSHIDQGAEAIGRSVTEGIARGLQPQPLDGTLRQQVSAPTAPAAGGKQTVNMGGVTIQVSGDGTPEQNRQAGRDAFSGLLDEARKRGVQFA